MNLSDYDIIIINSSGGKDSIASMWQISQMCKQENYTGRVVVSHQDLGRFEWKGVKELVKEQSDFFGWELFITRRRNNKRYEENLLEYARRRGKWPSNNQRWCTSDFKRGPGARVVTALTKGIGKCKVLYVFGFRATESPSRSKKEIIKTHKKLTTKKRTVHEYLPIHNWSNAKVWQVIRDNNLPYHYAYDLGMPRLSCCFCIFAPFDALVIAGYDNPELLDEYVEAEKEMSHDFRHNFKIAEVKEAIGSGYRPERVENWKM